MWVLIRIYRLIQANVPWEMILSFSWTLHNHLHLLENSQRTFVSVVSGRIELKDISTFKTPYSASTSEYIFTCKTHKTNYISTFKINTFASTTEYISSFKNHALPRSKHILWMLILRNSNNIFLFIYINNVFRVSIFHFDIDKAK